MSGLAFGRRCSKRAIVRGAGRSELLGGVEGCDGTFMEEDRTECRSRVV